jgi:hypothetical protein
MRVCILLQSSTAKIDELASFVVQLFAIALGEQLGEAGNGAQGFLEIVGSDISELLELGVGALQVPGTSGQFLRALGDAAFEIGIEPADFFLTAAALVHFLVNDCAGERQEAEADGSPTMMKSFARMTWVITSDAL